MEWVLLVLGFTALALFFSSVYQSATIKDLEVYLKSYRETVSILRANQYEESILRQQLIDKNQRLEELLKSYDIQDV